MKKPQNNYAFIDSQNLYLGIKGLGWKLDFKRFRVYLSEKYGVGKAYFFVGYLPANERFYNALKRFGYEMIFKTVSHHQNGEVKGNVDAELVLQAMIDYARYDKAVIITGDGDFCCLVNYLKKHNKLLKILAPSGKSCSSLLRKSAGNLLNLLEGLKIKLEYKKQKTPQ